MKVHAGNYAAEGFTASVSERQLARLAGTPERNGMRVTRLSSAYPRIQSSILRSWMRS